MSKGFLDVLSIQGVAFPGVTEGVYDVASGSFKIGYDSNKNYNHKGTIRGVFACATRLTDDQLETWKTMLDYEGYFDLWRDDFAKWSGSRTFTSGNSLIGNSPYKACIVES